MKWIIYGIIALVLVGVGAFTLQDCSHKKEVEQLTTNLKFANDKYDSCVNAKVFTKTHFDTIWRDNYIKVEKVAPVDSMEVWRSINGQIAKASDTIETKKYWRRYYPDTLLTGDFLLPYSVSVDGYLNSVRFGDYQLFQKTTETSHVIQVPTPVHIEHKRSHLYFYFGVNAVFDPGLSGINTGLTFISKKGWGIGAGYMRYQKDNIIQANVHLKLL